MFSEFGPMSRFLSDVSHVRVVFVFGETVHDSKSFMLLKPIKSNITEILHGVSAVLIKKYSYFCLQAVANQLFN